MKQNGKIILKKAILISLSVILFTLCSALIYLTNLTDRVQRPDPDTSLSDIAINTNLNEDAQKKISNYWTIAVFGVDSRTGNIDKGTNADVQLLFSINRDTSDIRLISLYRDTYLQIDSSNGNYGKLNQAYFKEGATGNLLALNRNLDITAKDFVSFNWNAVAEAINLLGGVDISLSEAEFRYMNSFITETVTSTGIPSAHLEAAGMQHLDGVQAIAYMRLRLMDTDYNRTERQRKVISQVFNKMKDTDLETLHQVMYVVLPQIGTSIDTSDFLEIITHIKEYNISMTAGFPFTLEEAQLGRNGECVIPNTLESNVVQLHKFLYDEENYQCSEKVREISREIIKDAVKN